MTAAPAFDKPTPAPTGRRDVDWERHNGHGGPKILPPPGETWLGRTGRPVGHRYYTRVTTFAKAIDDVNKLMDWKMRQVALGLGRWPAGVVAAAGLTNDERDKKDLQELAEQALKVAGGGDAALKGTALHTFTERLDRGEPLGFVPPELAPLLDAYRVITAPLSFVHREVRMVCDDLETAGTPDALGYCSIPDPDGVVDGLRVIDLKSGKISYPGPMSCQLFTYSASDLYDPATGARTPVELNRRWGLIVHAQQDGTVPPGLYWLDLTHGAAGVKLARGVRAWRKVKADAVLRPVQLEQPATVEAVALEDPQEDDEAAQDGTEATRRAIAAAVTTRDLDLLWQATGTDWDGELADLAAARHAELREQEQLEPGRAALSAALQTADGPTLHRLWTEHGSTPLWTETHSQMARHRHDVLTTAGAA